MSQLLLACLAVAMTACSGLPQQPERTPTSAILDTADTRLARAIAPHLDALEGLSAFHPVGEGTDAFVARVALARAADRTLDVQYYIYRGVRVTVLTNSFAATHVRVVHAGYGAYREELLRAGVRLYELKPARDDSEGHEKKIGLTGSSKASLHAKTYMVDGKSVFVGSLNLDPRSALLNTEMGIVVESEALCGDIRGKLLRACRRSRGASSSRRRDRAPAKRWSGSPARAAPRRAP